jgi:hypothetical protein
LRNIAPGGARGDHVRMGVNAGLLDQLDRIKAQADHLRDKAVQEMRRCTDILAKRKPQIVNNTGYPAPSFNGPIKMSAHCQQQMFPRFGEFS